MNFRQDKTLKLVWSTFESRESIAQKAPAHTRYVVVELLDLANSLDEDAVSSHAVPLVQQIMDDTSATYISIEL
jgi:hypothetical protein